jgi:hypothetical protein
MRIATCQTACGSERDEPQGTFISTPFKCGRGQQPCAAGDAGKAGRGGRTKSRTMPKQKQKRTGPARSASSMMRSSGLDSGLRTVSDFATMCEKLMPSSATKHRSAPLFSALEACDRSRDTPSSNGGSPSKPLVPNASHHLPSPWSRPLAIPPPPIEPMLPLTASPPP